MIPDGKRILIADDSESLARSMSLVLRRRGHTITMATNGVEAVRLALAGHYDIILLDMKLPMMDGLETYLGIKEIQPAAQVVVMTGYWEETVERIRAALDACAKACLRKPLDLEEVLQIVEQLT